MLQQTQVTTVVGYFRRFIVKWPTLTSLASANSQEVLRMWQGLGYYRRAVHLHAAAQIIVRDGRGKVPRKIEDLVKLPGVGLYSAGAIASIAHGQCVPAVDANAARVLARWFAIGTPLDQSKVRSRLWQLAEQLVPAADPGEFNQALMEFGSMVCTPRNPRCVRCPMVHHCRAHRMGAVSRFPVRRPRPSLDRSNITSSPFASATDICLSSARRTDYGLTCGSFPPSIMRVTLGRSSNGSNCGLALSPIGPKRLQRSRTRHPIAACDSSCGRHRCVRAGFGRT